MPHAIHVEGYEGYVGCVQSIDLNQYESETVQVRRCEEQYQTMNDLKCDDDGSIHSLCRE